MKYLFFKELKEPESLNKCKPMEAIFSLELLKLVQRVVCQKFQVFLSMY